MVRPRKFVKAEAEHAARHVFHHKGYAGTSMTDLTEATGLGKGSLYNAFGSKEELYQRAFHDYCHEAKATTLALLEDSEPGLSAVSAYVDRILTDTARDTKHIGCMIAKATSELSATNPAVVTTAHETLAEMQERLTRQIESAQDAGETRADAAGAADLALLVLAVTRGIEALAKAGFEEVTLRRLAPALAGLLARPEN